MLSRHGLPRQRGQTGCPIAPARTGVEDGGTTDDLRFTFETVACLGTCFLAPVVMVDEDYHGDMTADRAKKILEQYK